jgi:hypothetical protein
MADKTCMNCRFAVHMDFGYSNYTVEGTTFHCAKKAHPDGEFDEFYGEDKRLKYGADCKEFDEGDGVWMDVDSENEADLTPAQREVYEMHDSDPVGGSRDA